MINHKRTRGFTLIELTLVMAGMSILLLAILFATLHMGALYEKGVTNRTVNQMSRDVADMFRRDFAGIDASRVIYITSGTAPNISGRLCLGTVSYLWNTADLLNNAPTSGIKDASGRTIVFKRVTDTSQTYCNPSGGPYPTSIAASAATSDVISGNGRSFAVYNFDYERLATNGTRGLFELKLTLGTNQAGTTQGSGAATQCRPPADNSSDFRYCAVVDLDLIVRTGGRQ